MAKLLMTGNGAALQLPCGAVTMFDIEDYDLVVRQSWYLSKNGYVYAADRGRGKRRYTITMHSYLMMKPIGAVVDHINRNPLDNRKSNLRICTYSDNARNVGKKKAREGAKQSKYRGVSWSNTRNKWQVVVRVDGKLKHLGSFEHEHDAAAVADSYFKTYFHGDG